MISPAATPELTALGTPALPAGRPNLILAGFMGSGKTSAGRATATELGMAFLDLDDAIEAAAGRSVTAIFRDDGEAGFRVLERAALADAARLSGTVIATGGGAPLDGTTFDSLARSGVLRVLRATPAELAARLGDGVGRPLLHGRGVAGIDELQRHRQAAYERLGPAIDTTGRPVADVAGELAATYRAAAPAGPLQIEIEQGPERRSRIMLGRGLLAGSAAALREALPGVRRAALISDPAVSRTHALVVANALREAGIEPIGPVVLPAGEAAKTALILAELWERLRDEALDPTGAIVAVGGGAALDVAGFCAATFARGIALVNVPTTVLALADAAVGGKVAIDHAGAKNLVGAFHPARLVLADPATCDTLPPATAAAGLAEVIKALVLAAPAALEVGADAPLDWSIEQSLRIKAAFVAADPRDQGLRRALNLGHTYAHAIESASGHAIGHGAAVAIGLVAAARLGAHRGTCDRRLAGRLATVLERIGLATVAPALGQAALRDALRADKKRSPAGLRFVVPAEGGAALISGVTADDALTALGG